jgi:hypothetical protein
VRWAKDADALLERLAAEHRSTEQVAIVSSDTAVRGTAGIEVRKMASQTFLAELSAEPAALDTGDLRDRLDRTRWPGSSGYVAANASSR